MRDYRRGRENVKGERFLKRLPFRNLVRRVGFEPATPWFVARYSIQLSYRRVRTLLCTLSVKDANPVQNFFLVVLIDHCSAIFKAKAKQRFLINP